MNLPLLRNRTFDELAPGDSAALTRLATRHEFDIFTAFAGDIDPRFLDPEPALVTIPRPGPSVIHAMWVSALVSSVLGTRLPGPGTIQLRQTQKHRGAVEPGDKITATVTVQDKFDARHIVTFDTCCTNEKGDVMSHGTATVIAPLHGVSWPAAPEPDIYVRQHDRYGHFVREAQERSPFRTAVVHPCSPESLAAAIEARDEGLIDPLLIGPIAKIHAAAEAAHLDLSGVAIEAVEHSHAAAAHAVQLSVDGQVAALMKGRQHTDELLWAVVARDSGLRTDRRVSHVYAMDVPTYHAPLLGTDAAVNIAPTLIEKLDICQNAVDLLHPLGNERPNVAVLAAVETVNPKMSAAIDAASLTAMEARGQISGATVDGPLAFDNAISAAAAATKGIVSPVAGNADILLVPDLESGNMLAKQMIYFAADDAAGVLLGARVPIIVTSRADSLRVRLASVALAKLVVERTSRRSNNS